MQECRQRAVEVLFTSQCVRLGFGVEGFERKSAANGLWSFCLVPVEVLFSSQCVRAVALD